MTTVMWGYLRLALAGGSARVIEGEIERLAGEFGGSVRGRLFREAGAPAPLLWSLVDEADRQADGAVIAAVRAIADRRRVDLDRLLRAAPPTPALWRLLDALAVSGSGDRPGRLIVPSEDHFDGLGVSKALVLHQIAVTAPDVVVTYLDPGGEAGGVDRGARLGECGPDEDRSGVIADVPVHAHAEEAVDLVLCNMLVQLERRGLSDLEERASGVVRALVGAATDDASAMSNTLRVQARCPSGARTLAVEVWETRDHSTDPVPDGVYMLADLDRGGVVRRCRSRVTGATVTRCDLPLPGYERHDLDATLPPYWSRRLLGGAP
ncbi:hypothetical protein [Nocardia mexicana]|uniref:hypothetical protein n=1 Tax=Nocardia mexicana TaxID=279262 RepID=UPI0012F4A5D3|nr:hypothetical protein [Nocardia mexicana]